MFNVLGIPPSSSRLGTNTTFEDLKEYLTALKKDRVSSSISNHLITLFVVYYDRYIYNYLMSQRSISVDVTFFVKCQIAAFCEMLRSFTEKSYENQFVLLLSLCDITVINLEVITAQDLITSICPALSFQQIFNIIPKIEPPVFVLFSSATNKQEYSCPKSAENGVCQH